MDFESPLSRAVRGRRIALSLDFRYYRLGPDVEANSRACADALRGAGAIVEEVELGWSRVINDAWMDH